MFFQLKQCAIELCFKIGVLPEVIDLFRRIGRSITGQCIDIRMRGAIQCVVPKKTDQICICNCQQTFVTGKHRAALQKIGKEKSGFLAVCDRSEIIPVQQIGRQIIEENIRSLQTKSKRTVVLI